MNTISEIERNIREAVLMLEESEGEVTPEIEEILSINKNEVKSKIDQYHYVIGEIEAKTDRLDIEIKRLQYKKEQNLKNIDAIYSFVKRAILAYGVENSKSKAKNKPLCVDTGLVKANIKYTDSINISDKVIFGNVPDELVPFTKMRLEIILPLTEFADKLELLRNSEKELGLSRIKSVISNISKTEIKDKMEEGIVFEYATVEIKEKVEFK